MPTGRTTSTNGAQPTGGQSSVVPPIDPKASGAHEISSPYGEPNHGSPPHVHMGMDIPVPAGTACFAPVDGRITYSSTSGFGTAGGMCHFEFGADVGSIKKGDVIGWGHVGRVLVTKGARVTRGQRVAVSNGSPPHVHFVYIPGGDRGGSQVDGTADPTNIFRSLMRGDGLASSTTTPNVTDVTSQSIESISKAASISAFLDLPGILDSAESIALKGERSLMNDQPLLPFIEQLCQASLRNFQSMPNGNFFAFYPDYFGGLNHRTPYWEIADIEILNGMINLSDDALATHVYVVGDIAPFDGGINILDEIQTAGVVNVFNAFMADFMNGVSNPALLREARSEHGSGSNNPTTKEDSLYQQEIQSTPTLADKDKALSFLQKYGARPYREDAPMVRSPFFEMFLAYQKFCLLWSQQFQTTFEFTFMPELFPGGLVSFPDHGIQCYIDEVVHEGSYETGFITRANLNAPSSLRDSNGKPIGPRTNINEGMIRAGVFSAGGAGVGIPQVKSRKNKSNA